MSDVTVVLEGLVSEFGCLWNIERGSLLVKDGSLRHGDRAE